MAEISKYLNDIRELAKQISAPRTEGFLLGVLTGSVFMAITQGWEMGALYVASFLIPNKIIR